MLPVRTLQQILESDSGPHDPLSVAMEAFVSAPDAERWRIVAQVPVPASGTAPAGKLTILLVGDPLAGILLSFDRGSHRECKRLRPNGVHVCSISGQRRGPELALPPSDNRVDFYIDASNKALDRIEGGGQ